MFRWIFLCRFMVFVEGAGLIRELSDLTGRRTSVAHRNAGALLELHLQLCGTVHVFFPFCIFEQWVCYSIQNGLRQYSTKRQVDTKQIMKRDFKLDIRFKFILLEMIHF